MEIVSPTTPDERPVDSGLASEVGGERPSEDPAGSQFRPLVALGNAAFYFPPILPASSGQKSHDFLCDLAPAGGVESPTREDCARMNRGRKNKASNAE